jgi:hypothetical protein
MESPEKRGSNPSDSKTLLELSVASAIYAFALFYNPPFAVVLILFHLVLYCYSTVIWSKLSFLIQFFEEFDMPMFNGLASAESRPREAVEEKNREKFWGTLKLDRELNAKLEKLINGLLERYVESW